MQIKRLYSNMMPLVLAIDAANKDLRAYLKEQAQNTLSAHQILAGEETRQVFEHAIDALNTALMPFVPAHWPATQLLSLDEDGPYIRVRHFYQNDFPHSTTGHARDVTIQLAAFLCAIKFAPAPSPNAKEEEHWIWEPGTSVPRIVQGTCPKDASARFWVSSTNKHHAYTAKPKPGQTQEERLLAMFASISAEHARTLHKPTVVWKAPISFASPLFHALLERDTLPKDKFSTQDFENLLYACMEPKLQDLRQNPDGSGLLKHVQTSIQSLQACLNEIKPTLVTRVPYEVVLNSGQSNDVLATCPKDALLRHAVHVMREERVLPDITLWQARAH